MKVRNVRTGQFSYILKGDPSTRKLDLLGKKSMRDIQKIC